MPLVALALAALVIAPVAWVAASPASRAPKLDVAPDAATPGASATVTGTGFAKQETGTIAWDSPTAKLATYKANGRGSFSVDFRVPAGATIGDHHVTAYRAVTGLERADVVLVVEPLSASPTPSASATPPSGPSPSPTAAPVATPTATPTAVAPTPTPSATATAPSPTPTPTPTASSGSPDPLKCTGYPERRIFAEAQAWWLETPGKAGTSFGHMHVGACVPERQRVSGVVGIDVRIILHDNPGEFDYLNPVLVSDSQEISLPHNTKLHGLTCPTGTCTGWVHLDVDTSQITTDGFEEIRIRAYVNEPDGNIMHSSINTHPYFDNGNAVNDADRRPYERGKGWYTGAGYCEASFVSALPIAPLSGRWTPTVKVVWHGADDLQITHHTIRIDPDFHAMPVVPGIIVADGAGELAEQQLAIDTTALSNGVHKLHMRADCEDPRGSTNSGVLIIPFTVSN